MYIDSGSGSMIVSAVVAGAAGVGVVAKVGMSKITGAFRRKPAFDAEPQADTTEQQK